MTAVEYKMPNVSDLVKKADYDMKISDNENEYITTADYNKFIVANKIRTEGLVDKSATARFINDADLDDKIVTLGTKAELKAEQDKIEILQTFDSIYFWDRY